MIIKFKTIIRRHPYLIATLVTTLAVGLSLYLLLSFSLTKATGSPGVGKSHHSCYNCHDGSVAGAPDIKSDFEKTSHHPYDAGDSTTTCGPCHNEEGIKDSSGTVYPKLLQSQDSSGNYYYYGNQFCGACHGQGSTLVAGDHLTKFVGTKHDLATSGTGSGTGIKCVSCHYQHGTNNKPMLRETITTHTVTGDNNTLCLACHTTSLGIFAGGTLFSSSTHGSTTDTRTKWPILGEAGAAIGGAVAGNCTNCHNPHGTDYPKYTRREEENLCFGADSGCHSSALNSEKGIDIYANFTEDISNSRTRHNIFSTDQLDGSKVECINCHNPHINNRENKNIDPDNPNSAFTKETTDIITYPLYTIEPEADSGGGKDTTILGFSPSGVFADENILWVGYVYGWPTRALLYFDISSIPSSSIISKATLLLPQTQNGQGALPLEIEAHRNTSNWQASSASWNNSPSFDPVVASSTTTVSGYTQVSLDLTNLVRDWYNGTYSNYGITLMAPDAESQPNNWYREFYSSNRILTPGGASKIVEQPRLVISYTTVNVPKKKDIVSFCTKCHDGTPPSGVVFPSYTRQIDPNFTSTSTTGDIHGGKLGTNPRGFGTLVKGYRYSLTPLRCTNCHDFHGSKNAYMLKDSINGNTGYTVPTTPTASTYNQVRLFCGSCHTFTHVPGYNCFSCHFHGANSDSNPLSYF